VALTSVADLTTGSLSFNGDDTVILVKSAANTTVDAFGQIGFDPGAEWGAGLVSTADNTLRRKVAVCDGDLDGANVFDPSIEWDGFATDTSAGSDRTPTPAGRPPWLRVRGAR
jgi:hypothetical protein